jgi:hypothetical protein
VNTYKLFLDLDGVLTDLDSRVREVTGKGIKEFKEDEDFWKAILRTDHLFDVLKWLDDGQVLWSIVKELGPYILSSAPHGRKWEDQKREWVEKNLSLIGRRVIILTPGETKIQKALEHFDLEKIPKNQNWILIDDWAERNAEPWIQAGGIFVHYTSLEDALQQLINIPSVSRRVERSIEEASSQY